jgi:hypothetical protein
VQGAVPSEESWTRGTRLNADWTFDVPIPLGGAVAGTAPNAAWSAPVDISPILETYRRPPVRCGDQAGGRMRSHDREDDP